MNSNTLLAQLEKLRNLHDQKSVDEKLLLLLSLHKRRFSDAIGIHRFHDILTFLRAYPNNKDILKQVELCLGEFSTRSDLRRHRNELASSGIAGCPIDYRFFYPMAVWLAKYWGEYLHIDWPEIDEQEKLMGIIPLLTTFSENSQFDDFDFTPKEWLQRLKGEHETDASFLIKRISSLYKNRIERESLHDKLDIPFRLLAGKTTPSITNSKYLTKPVTFVKKEIKAKRPNLRSIVKQHPVQIRTVSNSEGKILVDLARTAMITHERDLDAISHGAGNDVRLVDCGDGLQFVCIGTLPERRYLIPGVYGFLNLKNGIPIGYFQVSVLFDMAEISFNTFTSFRGSDAAHNYAKALAMTNRLFGTRTFVLDNYQLGYDNKEGLLSGVWWFYYKLGFRSRNKVIKQLISKELSIMKRKPGHRSSLATLNRLAEDYMFFELDPNQRNENLFPLSWNIAPGLSTYLAERFGADREKGLKTCAQEAALRLGLKKLPLLSPDERYAWNGWAPLVMNLSGLERWSLHNRRSLVKIIRAKGGRRESDYITMLADHKPLQRAIVKYAKQVDL